MALYSYVKKKHFYKKGLVTAVSAFFIISGFSIIIWVAYPILSFEIFYAPKFKKFVSPVPVDKMVRTALAQDISQILGTTNIDYTKASTWYPKATGIKHPDKISSYTLSIPKLKIENAIVLVGGEDLAKSLIQFTGSLPGEYGNPVIFGHSGLLWLYNPKDYKYIFSKLPDLDEGDTILVTSDNITYQYKVEKMWVTNPDDFSVLDQYYDNQYLILITCVPQGTYLRRFVVKARLEQI